MVINPQGTLKIMRDVPFRSDMKEVLLFDSKAQQTNYMERKTVYRFTDFSYIREQRVIRVNIVADNLFGCNYLSFNNRGFGDKTFYAFITDVRYVNNETTEISFEIDMFQTWWFSVYIPQCFVEREHVNDDTIGANTVAEDVDTGDLCVHNIYTRYWTEKDSLGYPNWRIAIQVKPSMRMLIDNVTYEPIYYGERQFYPLTFVADVGDTSIDQIRDWIEAVTGVGGEITNVFMYPKEFEDGLYIQLNDLDTQGVKRPTSFIDYPFDDSTGVLPVEYVPKNNKLYTFPYTKLLVASTDGNQSEFQWERCKNGKITFNLYYNRLNKPSCDLVPSNYFRDPSQRLNTVSYENFPTVTINQNQAFSLSNMFNALGVITRALGSAFSGMITSAASGVANEIGKILGDTGTHQSGTTDGCLDLKYQRIGYIFYVLAIDANHARVIDDFFTRYGYQVNRLKTPNLKGRAKFNYVKTRDCRVVPVGEETYQSMYYAPEEALNSISDMFNRGITLWHNEEMSIDYTNNPIVTP